MLAQRKIALVFIGLGGNSESSISRQAELLRRNAAHLAALGCSIVSASPLYLTAPVGGGRQPEFVNAVIAVRSALPPSRLLRAAKALERAAGRRKGRRNGPRPIDIDILDYGGRTIGLSTAYWRSPLTLPHPELHRRRFVLVPLMDVAPKWQHPVFDRTVQQLLAKLPAVPGAVQRILDSSWISCDDIKQD